MRTITIREIRLHWPSVEKRLRSEKNLAVTRHGTPVAVLSRPGPDGLAVEKPRFDPNAHLRWLGALWKGKEKPRNSDAMLEEERGE